MSMVKWMSIPNFHSLRRSLDLYAEKTPGFELPVINYRAKVKLHGTNAGVHIKPSGQVIAQSRDRFITPGDDNYGFAKWVDENEGYFASLAINRNPVTIYGEWCERDVLEIDIAKQRRGPQNERVGFEFYPEVCRVGKHIEGFDPRDLR